MAVINEAARALVLSACVVLVSSAIIHDADHHSLRADVDEFNATKEAVTLHKRVVKPKFRIRGGKDAVDGKQHDSAVVSKLPCDTSWQVRADSDKNKVCPNACPYYAQDLEDDKSCTFKCVAVDACAAANPKRPIADFVDGKKYCRGPSVPNCAEYNYDGTDTCKVCQSFYTAGPDGDCHYKYSTVLLCVVIPLVLVVLAVMVWFVNVSMRTWYNPLGLKQGLACRSQAKVNTAFQPEIEGTEKLRRSPYPVLQTNMCKQEEVAGPGMLLHFNFQFICMIWAFGIAFIWWCFAKSIDEDMFILGTRSFGTPRENCILVAWGYETQQRLMPAKVRFLIVAYFFTFIGSLVYSIRQMRMLQVMDRESKTMKDFAVILKGLPQKNGDGDRETEIKEAVEAATGESVVGVSICWDYDEQAEQLMNALDKNLIARQKDRTQKESFNRVKRDSEHCAPESFRAEHFQELRKDPKGEWRTQREFADLDIADKWNDAEEKGNKQYTEEECRAEMGTMSNMFYDLEKRIVDFCAGPSKEDPNEYPKDSETAEVLKNLTNGAEAFIVFKTEQSKNDALEKAETKKITVWDTEVHITEIDYEPDTVNWEHLAKDHRHRLIQLLIGFGYIFLGLTCWATLFYGPYFYGQITFNYENGAMPPAYTGLVFTLVVCVGNVIMYEVCARVSDNIGFRTRDDREACYVVLYVIACSFNVILDFVCTYMVALKVARAHGFRTYFGEKIENIESFTEQFETYAMQRILAQNAFDYAWPSTFLIPFLLEPIVTVYVPYKISQLMVRTHPEWIGRDAELWLACIPFDMGRYGDLQLNMLLGLMIFFFPSGYTLNLFLGMGFSHVYIYMFDHWKVLSAIPKVIYANGNVDWYSQWLLAPITATLAACIALKANRQGYGYHLEGMWIVLLCTFAFIVHVVVHTLLLIHVVPKFAGPEEEDPNDDEDYQYVAKLLARNWFSCNPVHCLRSLHIHKHTAPCHFMYDGKEHLLKPSPACGCYFQDDAAETEDYSTFLDWKAASQIGQMVNKSNK